MKTMWEKWCKHLQDLMDIEISCWYFKNPHDVELYVFCDASQAAYGTVICLRYASASDIRTSFVISKERVAPLKTLTFPWLKLLGAGIAAQLLCVVQPHFPSEKTYRKTSLMYEELNTVEAVINSTSLTYVYNDVNEPDPLTPSHFTVGS
ncbi:hypothetical protein TNIN_258241 [Trichonephila inaurata madagascariensis]|uniref:Uncharacterized protein n=1 Tax=Trichonephila inaurata madagascariensis TaxID=2747483 RepID=A0A8X6WQG6_9ARAC|nr:hypothetical protein TNIN_258241 [Trichonephila inaurata madagascariensis]